jgi:hypothetical protein
MVTLPFRTSWFTPGDDQSRITGGVVGNRSRVRDEAKDLPERITRRRVRDHLDEARRRMGPISNKGIEAVFDELKA